MPMRNKQYGEPKECERHDCHRTVGAPLRSVYSYGCVLCVVHEDEYQLGNISLPESASEERKERATEAVLG